MRRTFWAWARLIGGAGIITLLAWRLGTTAFLDGLRVIDGGTVLAALGIGVLTTVCSAWRWSLVARGLGIRLPLAGAVADYYRALFLNAALPGGVLGDVDRAVRNGRDVGDVRRSVKAVILERAAGQVVLVTAAVAVLLVLPSPVRPDLPAGIATGAAAGLLAAAVAGWLYLRRGRFAGAMPARSTWPGVLLASVVVLVGHVATFVVAARAAGAVASLTTLLPLLLLALLAMGVPLNVGGWGPREGVLAWAFGAAGLGAAQGLTIAVVYGLLALVAALPGAGVLLVRAISRIRPGGAALKPAVLVPAVVVPAVLEPTVLVPTVVVPSAVAVARHRLAPAMSAPR